ncbi:MAG: HAD family phosphatase [Verrucomicrobia bacterium]|nr:HAD family phosphatase [Verrucomicrobiota bacterium]
MISAVIFDFDGIIVDSERLHWSAFNKVLDPRGKAISWTDYIQTYIGFDDRDMFRAAFPGIGNSELAELIRGKGEAFQELLESDGAAALPGSVALIKSLSGNIPLAICSGALRADILPILGILGIENAFDFIVTADDTHISKPDPAPYKLAMKKLGVTSGLAIEDTPAGISSAKGAGLKVLSVTNSYPAEALTMADAVIASLEGLTLEKLNRLVG